MTEAEWLACDDPEKSLGWLVLEKASLRKLRLFSVACGRHVWASLSDSRSRNAIEVAERFADGLATPNELSLAHDAASALNGDLCGTDDGVCTAAAIASADVCTEVHPVTNCASAAVPGPSIVERSSQADFVREIFGNPFRRVAFDPAWNTVTATSLAQAIYDDRAFDRLPILADALEDAGCTNRDILDHCRLPGEHVRGCWVVDLVLGKS